MLLPTGESRTDQSPTRPGIRHRPERDRAGHSGARHRDRDDRVFWMAGALMAWGLVRGHPYVALVPPLVLTLQFATMDRAGTGLSHRGVHPRRRRHDPGHRHRRTRQTEAGWHPRRMAVESPTPLAPSASALLSVTLVRDQSRLSGLPERGLLPPTAGSTGGTTRLRGRLLRQRAATTRSCRFSRAWSADCETPVFLAEISGDVAPTRCTSSSSRWTPTTVASSTPKGR